MPKITFESHGVSVSVRGGSELLEVYRKYPDLPLKFGCTRGECGVCVIRVVAGLQNLTKKSCQEAAILQSKQLDDTHRLACQCAVNGDIVIE